MRRFRSPLAQAPLALLLLLGACAKSAGDWNQPPDTPMDLSASDVDLAQAGAPDMATGGNGDMANGGVIDMTADLTTPPDLAKITNCVILPQSGCPAGQKCTTNRAATGTVCDPEGPNTRGQACTTANMEDSCAKLLTCIDEGRGKTQCRQFCASDADCGPRAYCQYKLDAAGTYKICSNACNAIYPGAVGCQGGLGCYVAATEHTDCKAPGTAGDNQPCNTGTDCKAGMVCYGPVGASVCHRICKKGDSAVCLGTDDCYNYPNWTGYGICCHWLNGC